MCKRVSIFPPVDVPRANTDNVNLRGRKRTMPDLANRGSHRRPLRRLVCIQVNYLMRKSRSYTASLDLAALRFLQFGHYS